MVPFFWIARPGTNYKGCRQGTRTDEGHAARDRGFAVIVYAYICTSLFSVFFFPHLVVSHVIDPFNTVLPTRLDMSCLPPLYQEAWHTPGPRGQW